MDEPYNNPILLRFKHFYFNMKAAADNEQRHKSAGDEQRCKSANNEQRYRSADNEQRHQSLKENKSRHSNLLSGASYRVLCSLQEQDFRLHPKQNHQTRKARILSFNQNKLHYKSQILDCIHQTKSPNQKSNPVL
ncbi:hypothetical protein ACH5RR_027542 [Cinchona calisaya]|uniref:Uncharacterized protein n=1 Tax=Cinchona calisaya TaxID=153742 RepID=A0ABD2Z913_9GENT